MSFIGALIDLVTSILSLFTSSSKPAKRVEEDDDDERDHWYGWQGIDATEFWTRILDIEAAGETGGHEAMAKRAKAWGLPGFEGYGRVKDTFLRHFQADPAFMQAMTDASMARIQGKMDSAAVREGLLDPIEGIDCETWANLSSKLARQSGDAAGYQRTLAAAGLDAAKFERVQEQWLARMRSTEDPYGAAKIAQVYSAAFTGGHASAADGPEPCTLERYAEIGGRMSAWSKDGHDVNARMRSELGLTEAEYGDLGSYWSARLLKDVRLVERYSTLLQFYEDRYRTTKDSDADLVF